MDRQAFLNSFQLSLSKGYSNKISARVAHIQNQELREAGVLIGLVERNQELNVILTARAKHLKHHPGQISFPGGKRETHDHTIIDTAIRETEEETGIFAEQIEIIGTLPALKTISRFSVTPVVGFISDSYTPVIDRNEVDSLFEVPLSFLLNTENLKSGQFFVNNQFHEVSAIPYQQHFIWGVTAQIIQAVQRQISFAARS